jgi:transposase
MPPVDRNNPQRAESSESDYSIMEFFREFPDDATCLEWLWRNRYSEDGSHAECPSCERVRKFHKVSDRPAWDCDSCGHHIHPTAGTIFHKSSTSLHLWFYAMHLLTSTRCGISAKQLERELGVTYKTAWRIANLIRNELMVQDDEPLSGDVEVDETYVGGKPRAKDILRHRRAQYPVKAGQEWARRKRTTVFGMVERGGRVKALALPKEDAPPWKGIIGNHVLPASSIFTDEHPAYLGLHKTHKAHYRIHHSEKIYVDGNVHTNTIEGFFSTVKSGIRGVFHSVSAKWLQGYLNEYAWRYNQRHSFDERPLLEALLLRAVSGV